MASKYFEEYKINRELLKDIEFIKREFGVGSVGYRAIEKLSKELEYLQNENIKLLNVLRKKEITIDQYKTRLKNNGLKLM